MYVYNINQLQTLPELISCLACASNKVSKVPDEAKHNLKGSTYRHVVILTAQNLLSTFITCRHIKLHKQAGRLSLLNPRPLAIAS
jgi:hypothetical protein